MYLLNKYQYDEGSEDINFLFTHNIRLYTNPMTFYTC